MRLRSYQPADLAAIHAINQAAVPAVGTETIDDLGWIADASIITVVAETDDTADGTDRGPEIAGFCLVLAPGTEYDSLNYQWFSERYNDFVYLDRVAISPAYKRRGLGLAMYTEVERLAGERCPTATQFLLEVNLEPRNDDSLAFHARLGFVEVGQQRTDYGHRVSLMAKPL